MAKQYDVVAKVGVRKDNDGKETPIWQTVGSIQQGEKGPCLALAAWFNPSGIERRAGSDSILLSLFEPKRKDEGKRP